MSSSNPHKLFAILGLLPSATEKEVKKAYHKLALIHHPDKGTNSDPEKMKAINMAYTKIMDEKLYRPPRTGSSADENEPWYEFTQPWRPTPDEFREFNEACISAYVERYDDEIRPFVPGFDELEENQHERLRHRYRVWLNGSKKQAFEPFPVEPSPSKSTPEKLTTLTSEKVVTNSTLRQRARKYKKTRDSMLVRLDSLLVIVFFILLSCVLCLNIVTPETVGVWLLCYIVITLCAPVGWTEQSTE